MAEETGSAEAGNPAPAPEAETTTEAHPNDAHQAQQTHINPEWVKGIEDQDLRVWAEGKHFPSPEQAVKTAYNLEKLMGADKAGRTVTMLGEDSTPEQRNEFFNKLGRPGKAEEYSFTLEEGNGDTARLEAMRGKAHELGITDAQFSGLAQADLEYLGGLSQGMSDDNAAKAADAEAQLKKDWGAAYDQKVAGIDVAAVKLGMSTEQLDGLRNAMGPVEAMKFVDGLNTKMGDHDFDEGESVMPGHPTPDQAQKQLSELTMNKEFMDAWLDKQHPGHKAAVEKKAQLARLVTGVT